MRLSVIRDFVVAGVALWATSFATLATQAQQMLAADVILLSDERGLVYGKPVATKEIAARVTTYVAARSGFHAVTVQSCPNVRADTVQAVLSDLQKSRSSGNLMRRFVVALDLHEPDARLCV